MTIVQMRSGEEAQQTACGMSESGAGIGKIYLVRCSMALKAANVSFR
jgi:hypothetical protein